MLNFRRKERKVGETSSRQISVRLAWCDEGIMFDWFHNQWGNCNALIPGSKGKILVADIHSHNNLKMEQKKLETGRKFKITSNSRKAKCLLQPIKNFKNFTQVKQN